MLRVAAAFEERRSLANVVGAAAENNTQLEFDRIPLPWCDLDLTIDLGECDAELWRLKECASVISWITEAHHL
jgi:hypothetical protein